MPRVSVLLPTYNRANYLAETIASALGQTFSDLEVIVVDDGSTDNTLEVVRAIQDSRVRYVRQDNRGVSAALNAAWRAARGEYVALLGSDDVWLPNLLETLLPRLEADASLCLIYARAQGMDAIGRPLSQILGAPEKFPGETLKSLLYGDCVCGLASVIRRAAIERAGGFDETLVANEDWDMWIRLAELGRFAYRDQILARYRIHPQNLTGGKSELYLRLVRDRVRVLEKFYARAHVPAEAAEIRAVAFRNVYMDVAVRHFSVGRHRESLNYFARAVRAAPNPLATALRVTGVMIFYLYLSKTPWGVRLVDKLVARRRAQAVAGGTARH